MKTSVMFRKLTNIVAKTPRCVTLQYSYSPLNSVAAIRSDPNTDCSFRRTFYNERFYCQSPYQDQCWNCKTKTKKQNNFMCNECGKLQDITHKFDYFEILSLPREFNVPAQKLTKTFRQLQTLVHPDKFSNKSKREQENSAEWSSLINKAYKTLSHPVARGQYLLKLHGGDVLDDDKSEKKEFLLEVMERNEEVDETESTKGLNDLNDKIQIEINDEISLLNGLFSSNDLRGAKEKLVKIKYLLSIQNNIKKKLEKLIGTS